MTLSTQVALIVAAAILIAQAINFSLAVEQRRNLMLKDPVAPAAQRLAAHLAEPNRFERLIRESPDRRQMIKRARQFGPRFVESNPVPPGASRDTDAEEMFQAALAVEGVDVRQAFVILPARDRPGLGHRLLLYVLQLEDGRWVAMNGTGPPSLRPLAWRLGLQSLLIGLLIIIPTLLLLHRVGRSLNGLTKAADDFTGLEPTEPLPLQGPQDVRALIEAVNKMQARVAAMIHEKDIMLGAIGHDLRTPLTALRLEVEGIEDRAQRQTLIDQIERLHGQFEQILEFARLGRAANDRQVVALDSLLKSATLGHKGEVRLGEIQPVKARIQPGPMKRAIDNLVENALRYGGDATLSLRRIDKEAVIIVRDNGPGISPELHEEALRPFGRLEGSRSQATGGHGLGLAIVAAIVGAQGGRLELGTPEDGNGMEARLYVPCLS